MEPPRESTRRPAFLERLVLHRSETRAWALYDWANSAAYTVIITAVFPIFYRQVAAVGLDDDAKRESFSWATTIAMLVAALMSPVLGAAADYARIKKKLFGVFLAVGVLANAAMVWIGAGDWKLALVLFGLLNIGMAGSFVFYDAMLSSVAREDEMDRLSTTGYAVGYLGGGLCLALCLLLIQEPEWFGLAVSGDAALDAKSLPTRIGFGIVALWWFVFTIPFFLRVREPDIAIERDERAGLNPVKVAFARLSETLRELKRYRQAFLFMLAFLVFNDGIGTIIRMATPLGDELGISKGTLIACVLLVQFVAIPFALFFGRLASRLGAKRSILIALAVYVVICVLGWAMAQRFDIVILGHRVSAVEEFVTMAMLVAAVQGGAQALSRSLFASLVPKHKSGEFFGLFSTLEKLAGVLGPLVFGLAATTGSAILSLLVFFLVGAGLLMLVDVEAGRRAAVEAEVQLTIPKK
jgi:UMF1 family MFS transporter